MSILIGILLHNLSRVHLKNDDYLLEKTIPLNIVKCDQLIPK